MADTLDAYRRDTLDEKTRHVEFGDHWEATEGRRQQLWHVLHILKSAFLVWAVYVFWGTHLEAGAWNIVGKFITTNRAEVSKEPVKWRDCGIPNMDCGTIDVPLNYFNLTEGVSTIAVARYKATKTPKKGSVFLNPGGPGASGVEFVKRASYVLPILIGPDYDLIGFDSRGMGQTRPTVKCFPDDLGHALFRSNTVFEKGFSVSSNLSDPHTREALVDQYREFQALKKAQGELCAENMGKELGYMGTANVVRDIDFMSQLLDGKDAPINYRGGSYGSILGAYLVNMLPDRVGRVVIDAIANPVLWSEKPSQYWHRDWVASTEDTYQIFLRSCSDAGPTRCPLARHANEDPVEIETRIDVFLDDILLNPLPVPDGRRPGYLTSGGIRATLLFYLMLPRKWPEASRFLNEAMNGNGTGLFNYLLAFNSVNGPDLARMGVICADSPPPKDESEFPTPEELADIGLETIANVSRHFGMSMTISEPDGGCEFWPVRPPERFTGPWNHTLANPMLIVSNTADPITPLNSGRLVNAELGNSSRLLIQNSPGHGSIILFSKCTLETVRAYYKDGTLPPDEFMCEIDEELFPDSEDVEGMDPDDAQLMKAAQSIGSILMDSRGM